MRPTIALIGILLLVLLTGFNDSPLALQTEPTPTITPTSTSQPAPPILIYPPDGAVLTQSITIQKMEFISTGFITYVTVRSEDFTARWCVELHTDCMPYDFENETVLLPDGSYEWQVYTSKPLGSAHSETWHFRVDTQAPDTLPLMLTATPTPTETSFFAWILRLFTP